MTSFVLRIAVKTWSFRIFGIFLKKKIRIEFSFNMMCNMTRMGSPVLPQEPPVVMIHPVHYEEYASTSADSLCRTQYELFSKKKTRRFHGIKQNNIQK